jgi:hypothetical protein
MRPFIIDDKLKTQIASLVAYAEKNPVSIDELLDTVNKQAKPVGDFSQHTLNLPFGYRIVYSIEEQPKGKIRHLSMSVNEDEKLPNEFVVREVMKLIGFKNELENCEVFLESISLSRQAVNVLEIIETDK